MTLVFLALLPAFHILLVSPYSHLASMRKFFPTMFNSLESKVREPSASFPSFKLYVPASGSVSSPVAGLDSKKVEVYSKIS